MTIPVELDPPVLDPEPVIVGPSAELLVQMQMGDYRDLRSLKGFTVLVDGQTRAWVPQLAETARIRVAPGEHRVRIEHRSVEIGVIFVVPIPSWGTTAVEQAVRCEPDAICGFAVYPTIDRQEGLLLRTGKLSR